jgi:hypothetical protein
MIPRDLAAPLQPEPPFFRGSQNVPLMENKHHTIIYCVKKEFVHTYIKGFKGFDRLCYSQETDFLKLSLERRDFSC